MATYRGCVISFTGFIPIHYHRSEPPKSEFQFCSQSQPRYHAKTVVVHRPAKYGRTAHSGQVTHPLTQTDLSVSGTCRSTAVS